MNEKPVHLPMDFDEALKRIARTPKSSIDRERRASGKAVTARKTEASRSPPRSGSRKTT